MHEAPPAHEARRSGPRRRRARRCSRDSFPVARPTSTGAVYWRALARAIFSRSGVPGCEERKSRKRASPAPLLDAQLGVAAHRGEEAHRAVGIVAGARRDADADAVGLELLRAREARELDLRTRERERHPVGALRVAADLGDAAQQRGLLRLVLADRRVARDHVRHLVAQHGGKLGGVVGKREQAARDVKLAVRQREGVDGGRVEDRHLVFQVRPLGGRDQLVDGLADQRLEARVLIGAAIGREDALVLALRAGYGVRPASAARAG